MILDHCDKKCHNLRTSVVISYWRLETRGLGVGSRSVFGWFHSYRGFSSNGTRNPDNRKRVAPSSIKKSNSPDRVARHRESGGAGGFLNRMLNGDAGLATTYWLWFVGGNIGFYFAASVADSSPTIVLVLLASCLYVPLVLVGLYRAAVNYSGPAIWALVTKIIVVIGWFVELVTISSLAVMGNQTMAISMTFLQAFTLIFGLVLCYLISKIKPIWWVYTLAFIFSAISAWIGGVLLWGVIFVSEDYTSAVMRGLSRSFLFAMVGPGIGIYLVNKSSSPRSAAL